MRGEVEKILDGIPDVEFDIDYMAIPSMAPYNTEFAVKVRSATERSLDGSEAGVDTHLHHGIHGLPLHASPGHIDLRVSRYRTLRTLPISPTSTARTSRLTCEA